MAGLHELSRAHIKPELHPEFAPAVLADHAYLKMVKESGKSVPLVIGLERGDGSISVYRTQAFDEGHPSASLNLRYAERTLKMLLWQRGGWRVIVGGPKSIGEHLRQVYSTGGARQFDSDFMGGVYEHPFTVDSVSPDAVPESSEGSLQIGRNLDGCRIGFDLGATDRKVAAVIDGQSVFSEEIVWDPRNSADPTYHFNEIMTGLKSAAGHMPRVDAIGGSSAGVYINNRPRVASLFRGVPKDLFDAKITRLFLDLQEAWGGIPFVVVNDGEVTALAGSMSLNDNAVLGIALGSSQAGGYVTPTGGISTWLDELAFVPVDYDPHAPVDEWSGDPGVGAQYFSQQAVFRLAPFAGIELDQNAGPAARLKFVQNLLSNGDDRARKIFETIGVYVGYGIAHYADFYELRHVLILGRVTSGVGGNIVLEKAQEILRAEFPELAEKVELHLPDEKTRRVGQAVAAASLPATH